LVLVFTGPSGHGKTELAKSLGSLLGVEMEQVNCTVMNQETDLFGPRPPMSDWQKGSRVNNFICRNDGKRSVIFMDEFEKTDAKVHNSLLIPFQEGMHQSSASWTLVRHSDIDLTLNFPGSYEDRRDAKKIVDCRKTIWILATNEFDDTIHKYHEDNKAGLESNDVNEQERL
jgi:energy-coupling factor transporter ATP-binding protein EcfA2